MVTRHAVSACCHASVQHFGGRRRRCARCGRTWRIHPHRRGRKRARASLTVLRRTIDERHGLAYQVPGRGRTVAGQRKRFQRTLQRWLAHAHPPRIPAGPLVLLIDGVRCRFARQDWTLYLLAVKPLAESRAYFLDPRVRPGGESGRAWDQILDELGPEFLHRIVALVSDGFRGSHTLALRQHWLHQRCHFHLVAQLHERRGRHLRLVGAGATETIYAAIREAVVTDSAPVLRRLQRQLRAAVARPECPRRVRLIVHGVLRHLDAFRTYRRYPQLHLPTTTNVLESMARRLRDRIRPLRTPAALQRWAVAIIRLRPILRCNGQLYQPK